MQFIAPFLMIKFCVILQRLRPILNWKIQQYFQFNIDLRMEIGYCNWKSVFDNIWIHCYKWFNSIIKDNIPFSFFSHFFLNTSLIQVQTVSNLRIFRGKTKLNTSTFVRKKESFIMDDDTMVYYSLNCGFQCLIS